MEDRASKRSDEPVKLEDVFKQAVGRLGDGLRMLSQAMPSSRSSSPTHLPSLSKPLSSNGSSPTHSDQGETLGSSSTSNDPGSGSSGTSNDHLEAERDVLVILQMRFYGTEEQSIRSTSEMLRHLEVRGYGVVNATHNGVNVESAAP